MSQRLKDILLDEEENYLIPLYWQKGEGVEAIKEEMKRIDEAGIKAVIVEARPHPDFVGPTWWQEVDVIMEEAKARGMKVWAFDDDHFPTGHAGGKVKDASSDLQRWFLAERHIDAIGPMKDTSFLIKPWINEGDKIVSIVAMRRGEISNEVVGEAIDVKHLVDDGVLYWDIPDGVWRIFIIVETMEGGSEHNKGYLNPLVAESTQILVDTVYEAYYDRYQTEFGKTFAGFFSDEPGFYNDETTFNFKSTIGIPNQHLPWRPDMLKRFEKAMGEDVKLLLPLLWYDKREKSSAVQFAYMDLVSQLYSKNFCDLLGNWCREHGVEYIGHVVEDNNVHTRLGPGTGHFFRSMWGQDMSGIDVVLNQILPGFDEEPLTWQAGETDSEFFHYALAKLGSSLGHIDPKKKGRTICEVFGAYGWHEGLKLMKWITDHMLVRGVNHFIPHAYSQHEYPDPDCPPHFYAQGKNPQHRYYRLLNDYTNRLSHLLNDGKHVASTAVLYPAEAEWSGKSMLIQKPVKELLQSQIDCDIIPVEVIIDQSKLVDGKLIINNESFESLIIPYAEALPTAIMLKIRKMADQGLTIIFVDGFPTYASETGLNISEEWNQLDAYPQVHVTGLSDLATTIKRLDLHEIDVEGNQPFLRFYHYEQAALDIYMFFNEDPYEAINTTITIPQKGKFAIYDAFENKLLHVDVVEREEGTELAISLQPYESVVFLVGEEFPEEPEQQKFKKYDSEITLTGQWSISTATSEQYPQFTPWGESDTLQNMSAPKILPSFTGTFRYELEFEWNAQPSAVFLDLGAVFEVAEVWLNDERVGLKICPPYDWDISDYIKQGSNRLVIEVTNTLGKEQKDILSSFVQQEPSGLLGPVSLIIND